MRRQDVWVVVITCAQRRGGHARREGVDDGGTSYAAAQRLLKDSVLSCCVEDNGLVNSRGNVLRFVSLIGPDTWGIPGVNARIVSEGFRHTG